MPLRLASHKAYTSHDDFELHNISQAGETTKTSIEAYLEQKPPPSHDPFIGGRGAWLKRPDASSNGSLMRNLVGALVEDVQAAIEATLMHVRTWPPWPPNRFTHTPRFQLRRRNHACLVMEV